MRNLILFLAVLTGLYSCSCNYHIRKVKSKCGYDSDTVTIHDTVVIESTKLDTVISLREMWHDTVVIVKGKDTYHFFYDTVKRSLEFSHNRQPILVPFVKKQVVNKYVEKNKTPIWVYLVLVVMGLVCLYAVFKRR